MTLIFCLPPLLVAASADEIFLGGKDFLLSGERSAEGKEVQTYLPHGATERDWEQRIEIHHYPELRQPRRVVMVFLDRLRDRYTDATYRILPGPTEDRAGVAFLVSTPGESEVRLEYLLYADTEEAPGLMAYRFIHRSTGPDARYSRSLLRGKWDYFQRAFLEVDWPASLDSVAVPGNSALFAMGTLSGAEPMENGSDVETRSLTVRTPEGRRLRVDDAFLAAQGIRSDVPRFSFSVPRETDNLFIEYRSEGVPEVLKLSLAAEEMQLAENLRVFPFLLPSDNGNERLWRIAGKLRRKVEEEYLNGWDDLRVAEPFLTNIGGREAFICLASFADPEGIRMFARFTLFLPDAGELGLLVFSQVDPRYSSVKRLEDLESGGVMTRITHSIRLLDPGVAEEPSPAEEADENSSPLPYDPIHD